MKDVTKAKKVRHNDPLYDKYDLFWLREDWKREEFGLYHKDGSLWGMARKSEIRFSEPYSMSPMLVFKLGKHHFLKINIIDMIYLNTDKKYSKTQLKRLIKDGAIEYWIEQDNLSGKIYE